MEDTATENQDTKIPVYKNTGEERRLLMSNAGAGCGPIAPSTESCIKLGFYIVRLSRTCTASSLLCISDGAHLVDCCCSI